MKEGYAAYTIDIPYYECEACGNMCSVFYVSLGEDGDNPHVFMSVNPKYCPHCGSMRKVNAKLVNV